MFGYVTANKPELKIKDFATYKSYYCGLCRTLKKEYGRIGQMTLTYDMTFLILLLTSLYETKPELSSHHCIVHPVKKHPMLTNEITDYAAAMNIALSYHHFVDDWEDERSKLGLAGEKILRRRYKRIATKYPRQCKAIETSLKKLSEYEKTKERSVDLVSGCFGELMSELLIYREDAFSATLRNMGFYLGKFIYLIDAYEDIEKDIKNNSYNVFTEKVNEKDFDEECGQILLMMMAETTKEFEKLPLFEGVDILRNILYQGVWTKYNKLLDSRNQVGKE